MRRRAEDTFIVCPWCFNRFISSAVLFASSSSEQINKNQEKKEREHQDAKSIYFRKLGCGDSLPVKRNNLISRAANDGFFSQYASAGFGKRTLVALADKENGNLLTRRFCHFCHNELPNNYFLLPSKNIATFCIGDVDLFLWMKSLTGAIKNVNPSHIREIKSYSPQIKGPFVIESAYFSRGRVGRVYFSVIPNLTKKTSDGSFDYRQMLLKNLVTNSDALCLLTTMSNNTNLEEGSIKISVDDNSSPISKCHQELNDSFYSVRLLNNKPISVVFVDGDATNNLAQKVDTEPQRGGRLNSIDYSRKIETADELNSLETDVLMNLQLLDPLYGVTIRNCFPNSRFFSTNYSDDSCLPPILWLLKKLNVI